MNAGRMSTPFFNSTGDPATGPIAALQTGCDKLGLRWQSAITWEIL